MRGPEEQLDRAEIDFCLSQRRRKMSHVTLCLHSFLFRFLSLSLTLSLSLLSLSSPLSLSLLSLPPPFILLYRSPTYFHVSLTHCLYLSLYLPLAVCYYFSLPYLNPSRLLPPFSLSPSLSPSLSLPPSPLYFTL